MAETQIDPAAEPQTPAREGGPVGDAMDMDSLINQHFGEGFVEGEDVVPPSPEDPEPQPEAEDTPAAQRDPEVDDLDTEVDLEGSEEAGIELEGDDPEEPLGEPEESEDPEVEALLAETEGEVDDEDLLTEDTSEEESFLPEFDRVKFLEEHPELEAPYKHMQSAFSKKMAELSGVREEAETAKAENGLMREKFTEFQEMLKDDDSFQEFLVEVTLNRPEVMERAYERALALSEDEGKKAEYEREKELSEREKRLEKQEKQEKQAKLQKRTGEIIDLTQRVANKLGLTGEGDLEVAEQFVANKILQNVANGGDRDLSNQELVVAVRRAATALEREKAKVRKSTKAKDKKERLKAAQDRVKNGNRRPAAPKPGSPTRQPKRPERKVKKPTQDALGSFIDDELGVDTML